MTNKDEASFKVAASRHKSVGSLASNISTSSTLRDEDLKDIDRWTDSPKRLSFESSEDNNGSSPSSPAGINRTPSPLVIAKGKKFPKDKPVKRKTAQWKELPNKSQLALLTLSRLAEPLTQTSLQSYMFYQLKSFDQTLPDDAISFQAGMLAASFTFAQFISAIPWGKAADSEAFGRKRVILIGLLGTMISALGFGFSKSFAMAVFWRAVGGALNGNVGVMRTVCCHLLTFHLSNN